MAHNRADVDQLFTQSRKTDKIMPSDAKPGRFSRIPLCPGLPAAGGEPA
jgi:hypothetical protein